MAGPRRLKVYGAAFGFHESIVAAPNQARALAAWGVRQNLFADGDARLVTDPAAVAAALANPGTPLRRVTGSQDPFVAGPSGLPKVTRPTRGLPTRGPVRDAPAKAKTVKPKRPPDRDGLDAAEARLRALDAEWRTEEDDFRRQREALDAAEAKARRAWIERREAATRAAERARLAYVRSGGEP